jgi:hypothetical protein
LPNSICAASELRGEELVRRAEDAHEALSVCCFFKEAPVVKRSSEEGKMKIN